MSKISNYANKLEVGKPQIYKNMAVLPLFTKEKSKLEYIVFDEALNSGLSVSETGSVPSLHFTNKTGNEILILQGEYVIGGKQNRMIATNVYMAKGFDGDVPVRCVEQGRWNYGSGFGEPIRTTGQFDGSRSRADDIRYAILDYARRTSDSGIDSHFKSGGMATKNVCFAAQRGQHEVWNEVGSLAADHGVKSATGNLGDVFREKKQKTDEYGHNFEYVKGSAGILIVSEKNGQKIYGAEIFDKPETMKRYFGKLLESYALEAASSNGSNVKGISKTDAKNFLHELEKANEIERRPVSLGRDIQIAGNGVSGFALEYGVPVYMTLSSRNDGKTGNSNQFPDLNTVIFGPQGHFRTGFYRNK